MPESSNLSVHELFDRQAARTPDRRAVLCGGETLTFEQLRERANQLAHHLRLRGAPAGSVTAIWCDRSFACVVAMLGTMKAGRRFVALDPSDPPERVDRIIADTRPQIVVTTSPLAARLRARDLPVACLDQAGSLTAPIATGHGVPHATDAVTQDPGSNGSAPAPPPAIVGHLSASDRLTPPPFANDDVCALASSPSGASFAEDLFLPMLCGAAVLLVSDEQMADGRRLVQALQAAAPASLILERPTLNRLLADPGGAPCLRAVRTVVVDGAVIGDDERRLLGAADAPVMMRGDRIDVEKIEGILRGFDNVREAAVAVHAVGGEDKLIAYVVADGLSPTVSQLRSHLQDRVPSALVPAVFVSLDQLPLTSAGTIDREALPPPNPVWSAVEQHYVAPRNAIEAAMAQIWAEALLVDKVGIHDDFLELGGDSLIATQVVARIWERFGTEVPFQSLFERGSIAELAEEYFADASKLEERA